MGSYSKASVMIVFGPDFASGKSISPLPKGVKSFICRMRVKDSLHDEWRLRGELAVPRATLQEILTYVTGLPGYV